MVELVVLLHQVVAIVGNTRRTVGGTRFLHHSGKVGQHLDESLFLFAQLDAGRQGIRDADTSLGSLAEHRLDTGIGVLDERTCVAVEVDGFLGVEGHILACIYLKDEVLERSQSHDAGNVVGLLLSESVQFAQFLAGLLSCLNHFGHQVVSIHHGSLAALHLALGQFHHTVGEVDKALAPLETEFVQQDREYLEVVVLLVAHDVDHLVDGEVGKAKFGGADILSHIDGSAIGTEKQFVVESLTGEVGPHGAILLAVEESLLQSLHHLFLTFEVGVRLVVNLVEADAHHLVRLVETGIYPVVHALPEAAHFGVASFPLHQHLAGFLHQRTFGFSFCLGLLFTHAFGHETGHQFLHFSLVVFVECHIIVANQVVALLAGRFGSFALTVLQPGQHALADVDTTVVHDVGLHHAVTVGRHNIGQRVAQEVVAHVSEVEGLIGVGR